MKCKECGTPLDEIPFVDCRTHRLHFASLTPLTEDELEAQMDQEMYRAIYERTGDD